jgi:uncharacterized Fe-S cluster-containing radical SAM superfamily enzyme
VSGRLVQDAEYIAKHSPELAEQVKAGEKTVNAAITEIKPKRIPKRPAVFHSAEEEEAFYEKAKKVEKANEQKDADTKPEKPGVGIRLANEAIACLARIPLSDNCRDEAWKMVKNWLKNNQ